jgi:hypothetical protein
MKQKSGFCSMSGSPALRKSLHRERWAWQENADIESVDEDHFVLIIRPGAAGRLAA